VALMKDGNFLEIGRPAEVMTQDTLAQVYGMQVSMISADDPNTGQRLKLCVPRLNNAGARANGFPPE